MIEDARGIVEGARQDAYGSPLVNHERIAGLWSVILGMEVSYQQVIQCMIAVKLARLCHSPDHRDSWQDIAGYAEVWSKAWTERTETL